MSGVPSGSILGAVLVTFAPAEGPSARLWTKKWAPKRMPKKGPKKGLAVQKNVMRVMGVGGPKELPLPVDSGLPPLPPPGGWVPESRGEGRGCQNPRGGVVL